ncbi:MAG: hypothetical protein P1V97_14055 [Planctomycetota bacterium]|nr:hypothetical protein [Planctomycetota bacterium]
MRSPIIIATFTFFAMTSLVFGQEPESKPASKPTLDKAKKGDEPVKKPSSDGQNTTKKSDKALTMDRKVAAELGNLKEVKAFLERMNKSAGAVLRGKNATATFGDVRVELEDSEQYLRAWKDLRAAGAHKFKFTAMELRLYIGVPGKAGAYIKSLALFSKGKILFVPGKVSSYEENFQPRGCKAEELPKSFKFLSVLGGTMRTKANECKRSKNFPFVQKDDFELVRALFKQSMTKERFAEDLKKQASARTKMFLKLKSNAKVEMQYDIDDALFIVEDKDGKEIGAFTIDFDLNKTEVTIQFKRYRARTN